MGMEAVVTWIAPHPPPDKMFLAPPLPPSGGRRGTGLSSGIGRSGRTGRRQNQPAHGSGQSANSGESLGDDDDDMWMENH